MEAGCMVDGSRPRTHETGFQRIEAHMTASQIMVTGFALAIFAGGILLSIAFLQYGWALAALYRCTVYRVLSCVCDRTRNDRSSDAVYTDRQGDPADSDSAWRAWYHRLYDGSLPYFKEADHDPQPRDDSGQL